MQGRTRVQPIDFRREEVTYIMQRWRAGDSCSLVGVGSVGKSNLLQHLAHPQTHQHYLGTDDPTAFKAIIIDPNLLGPLPHSGEQAEQVRAWAGYELMMHRLFLAFYPFEHVSESEAQDFYDTYHALQDGSNPLYTYMGLRYFELGLDFLFRRGIRLVFMFDEFEELLKQMPVKFFQNLRGLRDANKRQLSYLTFTRTPLPTLIDQYDIDMLGIEPFAELFTDNLLYVGPYNPVDARRMLDNLMGRNSRPYPEVIIKFLLWATGGFAGLLRAAYRSVDALNDIDESATLNDDAARTLARRRAVREECRTIWTSLTPAEQHVLKAAAGLTPLYNSRDTENAANMLVPKRLISMDRVHSAYAIEPPVFRAYVASNPEESSA